MTALGLVKNLIPAGQVQTLTGLTANQLREWSHRRDLIPPDVNSGGPGRPALYSWQNVLLLRLAVVLRKRFKIELQAHKDLLHALRDLFAGTPFPALRGCVLALRAMERGELLSEGMVRIGESDPDTLFLRLDPHLDVLEIEFAPRDQSRQLPLFRAVSVR
ncbi:MerR family transcriptional regulator [Methylobacterium sp. Leaf99]|uniref:MerR family transcriptional regulator n=1 Tax=Methylobacterium sp. Leaf99 TaxID=1736251 RepID=UPI0009EBDDEE|nr:MerR family transcriptional regulator [Methylobacterium sp. Leaf99]